MTFTDPATLAADLIDGFPAGGSAGVPRKLSGEEAEVVERASMLLNQTRQYMKLLEAAEDQFPGFDEQMAVLWSTVAFRSKINGTAEALISLRFLGRLLRSEGVVPTYTDKSVADIRKALEDLHETVSAQISLPEQIRDKLLLLIAHAVKACDDVGLFGAVTIQQATNDVVVEVLRNSDAFSGEEGIQDRIKSSLFKLIVLTGGDVRSGLVGAAIGAGFSKMLGG